MTERYADAFITTLSTAITSTVRPVTFSVAAGSAQLPSGTFSIVIYDAGTDASPVNAERLKVTAVGGGGTSWTAETETSDTAKTHAAGSAVRQILTSRSLTQQMTDHKNVIEESDPHTQYLRKASFTALGDLLVGTAAAAFTKLARGANNTVLIADDTQPVGLRWGTAGGGMTNPMTAVGDLIIALTGGLAARLGIGTLGQALQVVQKAAIITTPTSAPTTADSATAMSSPNFAVSTTYYFVYTWQTTDGETGPSPAGSYAQDASANSVQVTCPAAPAAATALRLWVSTASGGPWFLQQTLNSPSTSTPNVLTATSAPSTGTSIASGATNTTGGLGPAWAAAAAPTFPNQAANRVYAGPATGADAAPAFRALVAADVPAEATQSANTVKAGPTTGAAAAPAYRALVDADIPTLSTAKLGSQSANTVAAGPTTGAAAVAAFRALVEADIPALAQSKITGLVAALLAKIDASLLTAKGQLVGASASGVPAAVPAPVTDGHVLTAAAAQATGMEWAAPAGGGGGVGFDDAEGQPAVVDATAEDGTSANAARRDHGHALGIISTRGALIRGGVGGTPEAIVLGPAGHVFTSDGTDAAWAAPTGGGGGSGSTSLDVYKESRFSGTGNKTTTSTTFVAIDATNLPPLSLVLNPGDIVRCVLVGQVLTAGNGAAFDFQVVQPTLGTTRLNSTAENGVALVNFTRDVVTVVTTFTATEAGAHTFQPFWRATAGTITLTNATSGNDDSAILHSVEKVGVIGGAAVTSSDLFKQTKLRDTGNKTTTSTTFVAIDATNLAPLSLTLNTGDIVRCDLHGVAANSGANVNFFDFQVVQPTLGTVRTNNTATKGATSTVGTGQEPVNAIATFTATEDGVHTFQPVWLVTAGTATLYNANTAAQDTAILFTVEKVGVTSTGVSVGSGGSGQIFEETLGISQPSVTIPIPPGLRDLRIVASLRGDTAATFIHLRGQMNGDATAGNYESASWQASQTSPLVEAISAATHGYLGAMAAASSPASVFTAVDIVIPDYGGASHKGWRGTSSVHIGTATAELRAVDTSGRWKSTAPITSIVLSASAGNIAAGSTIRVYGGTAAGSGETSLDVYKQSKIRGTTNKTTTSTTFVAIDNTNLPPLSLTLNIGDTVRCVLQGQFAGSASTSGLLLDSQVVQPTLGTVRLNADAAKGTGVWSIGASRWGITAIQTFTATEAGAHTFQPVWAGINADTYTAYNGTTGNDDTALLFSAEKVGVGPSRVTVPAPDVNAIFQQLKVRGTGNKSTASTTFVVVDNTNLSPLSLTLNVGDVVRCNLAGTFANSSASGITYIDYQVVQPTLGTTRVNQSAAAGAIGTETGTNARSMVAPATFVAAEAGVHTFQPFWRVSAGTASLYNNASIGNQDPAILFTIEKVGAVLAQPYIKVEDQKASGTAGGGFSSGAWQKRALNTEVHDTHAIASLATDQITLPKGTFRVSASAPAVAVNQHQLRLQDVTNAVTLVTGGNAHAQATNVNGTTALLNGQFTLAAPAVVELQHRCLTTRGTDGFGLATSWGTEVYAVVEIWKES